MIKSDLKTLKSVFDNSNIFSIPEFQREFVWGREEVKQMLDDFSESSQDFGSKSSKFEDYLLGNIVLINEDDSDEYIVVDGQQRLTTISLIYKAIYNIINNKYIKLPDENHKMWYSKLSTVQIGFGIFDNEENYLRRKITHASELNFGNIYGYIVETDSIESYNEKLIEGGSDNNIFEVYSEIEEYLNEMEKAKFLNFMNFINTSVNLIVTTTKSLSKAFQLFEVLNERGKSLDALDLIKNNFLKVLNEDGLAQEKINQFNSNWSDFDRNLELTAKKKVSSSNFLKHYVMYRYGDNVKKEELYNYFTSKGEKYNQKGKRLSGAEILKISKEFKDLSIYYRDLEKRDYSRFNLEEQDHLYLIFTVFNLKQLHPLVMYTYKLNSENRILILDACVRLATAVMYSFSAPNNIEKGLPKIINKICNSDALNDQDVSIVVEDVNKLILDFTDNIYKLLPSWDFTTSSGNVQNKAINLLKFIEIYLNQSNVITGKSSPRKKISLEHIMPRKLEDKYFIESGLDSIEAHVMNINSIGNLTLLYKDENTSISNNIFKLKRDIYKNSKFLLSNYLIGFQETPMKSGNEFERISRLNSLFELPNTKDYWTIDNIKRRGENISDILVKIVKGEVNDR